MAAEKKKRGALLRLAGYLKPHRVRFAVCCVLVALITVLELLKTILIGNAIDRFITGDFAPGELVDQRVRGLMLYAGLYILLLVAVFFFDRAQYTMMQQIGQDIVYGLRNQLFEHVQSLTMRFFDVTPVGRLVTRVTNDVESVNELFSNTLVALFRNAMKIVGIAVIMLFLNVRMALYSFAMLPLVIGLTVIFRRLARKAYQLSVTRRTALNTFLSENLSGMKVIQIFAKEKEKFREFRSRNDDLYQAGFREMMVNAVFRPAIYFVSMIATCIILTGGGSSVLQGTITIGTLYVFIEYITQFFNPIQEFTEQLTVLQSAIASAEKVFVLLDTQPMIREEREPERLPEIRGRIEFDHVWFAYENEDGSDCGTGDAEPNYVLKDVSFTIEPGQCVAFVGATGAGKSSILNLIGRYYDVQKGTIRIDGTDIRQLSRQQIREAIGQVQQDVFVFTGDIRSNIRLRDEEIPDETVLNAARYTNADKFISRLKDGYDEPVGERGATFSAGERQLLSFARTLAHDPRILILDEATANIDTETEIWIQEAIEHLMKGRTTIMVAHRLSTIRHADRIIVMHHGRIRESGTHQELLEMNGLYKKLYLLQLP